MCTFLFWMVHCEIWNWCIVGFANWVNWVHNRENECTNYGWGLWIIVACRVIMFRARETDDWSHRQPALNITISFEPKQAKGKNANLNNILFENFPQLVWGAVGGLACEVILANWEVQLPNLLPIPTLSLNSTAGWLSSSATCPSEIIDNKILTIITFYPYKT